MTQGCHDDESGTVVYSAFGVMPCVKLWHSRWEGTPSLFLPSLCHTDTQIHTVCHTVNRLKCSSLCWPEYVHNTSENSRTRAEFCFLFLAEKKTFGKAYIIKTKKIHHHIFPLYFYLTLYDANTLPNFIKSLWFSSIIHTHTHMQVVPMHECTYITFT